MEMIDLILTRLLYQDCVVTEQPNLMGGNPVPGRDFNLVIFKFPFKLSISMTFWQTDARHEL